MSIIVTPVERSFRGEEMEQPLRQSTDFSRWQRLLDYFQPLRDKSASASRCEAFDFNLFAQLGLERQERIHSSILKNLLDPRGSHSQGDLFLRAFLDLCKSKYPHFSTLTDNWPSHAPCVYAEVPTGLGRPDLLILAEGIFSIVIENKIDASPGPNQIERYRKWLGNQPEAKTGRIALLFLTPCPQNEALPDKCFHLSYREDISRWIASAANDKRMLSTRVRHSLYQYLDVIYGLCAEGTMTKRSRQPALGKFVRQHALDIFELWEELRHELGDPRVIFWTELANQIRKSLSSKRLRQWEVSLSSEDMNELSNPNKGQLKISESNLDTDQLSCAFTIQEYANVLEYGVSWSYKLSADMEKRLLRKCPELVSLRDKLQSCDFKRHAWWVGIKKTLDKLDEKSILIDLYSSRHTPRLMAEKLLEVFNMTANQVHKLNAALRK